MRAASQSVVNTRYYKGNQIKEVEISKTCSTHGNTEKCIKIFDLNSETRGHTCQNEYYMEG